MPRKAIDYSKTIIYKLCCLDPDVKEIYVGHTTEFVKRKNNHKSSCNNASDKSFNLKVYQYMRTTGGFKNWSMIMLEKYPCLGVLEAKQKEQFYILELHSTLNSSIPNRTPQQYRVDNKESHKEYYTAHQEKIVKYQTEYRNINNDAIKSRKKTLFHCDCGSVCRIDDKSRHFKTKKHQLYLEQVH